MMLTFANCSSFRPTFEVRSVVNAVVGFVNWIVFEVVLPLFATLSRSVTRPVN